MGSTGRALTGCFYVETDKSAAIYLIVEARLTAPRARCPLDVTAGRD
jgi:hypothetical protein